MFVSAGRGRHIILTLPCELPCRLKEWFACKDDVFASSGEPSLADDSLLIDEEERALGIRLAGGQQAVPPDHRQLWKVAEERERQFE